MWLEFMLHITLFPMINIWYSNISAFRCGVHSMVSHFVCVHSTLQFLQKCRLNTYEITPRGFQLHLRLIVPWLRTVVPAHSPRKTGFDSRPVHVGFVVDKVTLEGLSPNTSVFPCQDHSYQCSTLIATHYCCYCISDFTVAISSLVQSVS
jgi:hypothetical protein